MSKITLSNDQKNILVSKLQNYFEQELDQDLGQFDAEFLLDFIAKEFGSHFYNQGLYDAQAILDRRVDEIKESIYELEQIVD
ncbi:hypothetical protein A3K86_20270 [Photobacterium jeanii]|uniref:1-(5-phosphoribosyl)-5-((5-phosphoribosylamino)methylideneamino)imidazole-4-carboxamide isomerase n=1 Tax=Photobacterium jeanii TaxID=858640 RepID=A0A178K3I8_9GAMM|nr:DUF2164 domain-containing protein [Photobacterium jeanii]OAN11294.1 hypothetical protein A3K86_20270 [Photobacterium jeanii]PST90814.1 DUF2164 domain-containing protein [Photobacterium jeanii]